jgi:hypothetical protein
MKIKNGTSAGCRSRRGDGAVVGTGCDGMECSCPEECEQCLKHVDDVGGVVPSV